MKLDLIKELGNLYRQTKKEISILPVPAMNFLSINGFGDPNQNEEYVEAVSALYTLAYKIKFNVKKGPQALDYAVMPLEGLWWAKDMSQFSLQMRAKWEWRMLIMQPEVVTPEIFQQAREETIQKKALPKLRDVQFISFEEGLCAQILHEGPYGEAERPSVERLHEHIRLNGYHPSGKHHEIYLNSPLRTAAEKLRTIIRQPIQAD